MKKTFIAVGNTGEHSGYIEERDADKIWSNANPNGWTYQDVCGSHGHVIEECDTQEEAQAALDAFLECDSVEKGRYCYTHNPHPQG